MAPLFLVLGLSVVCQAEPWTGCFAVGAEPNAGFSHQSFSIKGVRHSPQGNPSDIADTNGYTGPTRPPDDKPHRLGGYGIKATIIESISWQLLYATDLQVAHKLILTIKDAPLNSNPYSWLSVEVLVAVGWLLKSYWNSGLLMSNPIEQQKVSQDHSLDTITMMFGSGHNQRPHQPSTSSGQRAPQAANLPGGFISSLMYSDSGGSGGGSQQHSHTLGLNCFVHPCRGVCSFRPFSDNGSPDNWLLNSAETSMGFNGANPGQSSCPHLANKHSISRIDDFDPFEATHFEQNEILDDLSGIQLSLISNQLLDLAYEFDCNPANNACALDEVALDRDTSDSMRAGGTYPTDVAGPLNGLVLMNDGLRFTANEFGVINGLVDPTELCQEAGFSLALDSSETPQTITELSQSGQSQPHLSRTDEAQARNNSGQKICHVIFVGEGGQERLCGRVCKNARALSSHKKRSHPRQHSCDVRVVGEDGQPRPCGKVCKNARALMDHNRNNHKGPETCNMTVVGEYGQQRACKKICKNAQTMANHKKMVHGRQQTCYVTVVGEDGRQRPCGMVCKNAPCLASHKIRAHSGQQICDRIVVGEDGLVWPCGRICKSAGSLADHKRREHSGQQICDRIVVGKDGQQRPCAKVCRSSKVLSDHRRKDHSGRQTCYVTVVGLDGQQRPCGAVCKNARALTEHKGKHRKRKFVGMNRDVDLKSQ